MAELVAEQKTQNRIACCAPLDTVDMTTAQAEQAAAVFKALADPARILIVNLLAKAPDSVCVCDITPQVGLSQPTVSFHLKKLRTAGIVDRTQRGKWAHYSLRPGVLTEIAAAVDLKRSQ